MQNQTSTGEKTDVDKFIQTFRESIFGNTERDDAAFTAGSDSVKCIHICTGIRQRCGSVGGCDNGDPLIGANVMLENTILGSATDIDGMFTIINVPAGTYTLVVSYVGYQETRITDIEVKANESYKLDFGCQIANHRGEEVVVEARMIQKTPVQRCSKTPACSDAVSDGVSSEEFSPFRQRRPQKPSNRWLVHR